MQTDVRRIHGSDGISLHLCLWSPDSILDAKGVVQLLHGQGEYSGRYEHMAQYLTDRGFIVYANDHRGHGLTVFDAPDDVEAEHAIPGHMADVDGWNKCLGDLGIIRDIIRSEHPTLPLTLLGHSLGSFMVQDLLIEDSARWDAAVLLGSAGGALTAQQRAMEVVVRLQYLFKGKRGQATWTDKLVMEAFSKEIGMEKYRAEWLSHDPDVVLAAENDPMMNVIASAQHWMDLAKAIKSRARPENIAKVRQDIPLWIASGGEDPLGQQGVAVEALGQAYRTAGLTDVTVKIYEGMRHELHNEVIREQFFGDLHAWLTEKAAA